MPGAPPIRVVIIDDEPDTRTLMRAFLEIELPRSVKVNTATDQDYLTAVPWDEVAVAIVDLMMPKVDGFEILQWIRDTHPTCTRIAWTAAAESLGARVHDDGLAHWLIAKPGLGELRDLLGEMLP